jgi:hypothetical protein
VTRAEREDQARDRACPECHAEAGRRCRKGRVRVQVRYSTILTPGQPMKGVHAKRLALVPADTPKEADMPKHLPFTWPEFEAATGRPLAGDLRRRLAAAVNNPTRDTWVSARTIVVAPQMSAMGQTLWQCVEAVTLTRYPDGPATGTVSQPAMKVPTREALVSALCYAAGIPNPAARARA